MQLIIILEKPSSEKKHIIKKQCIKYCLILIWRREFSDNINELKTYRTSTLRKRQKWLNWRWKTWKKQPGKHFFSPATKQITMDITQEVQWSKYYCRFIQNTYLLNHIYQTIVVEFPFHFSYWIGEQ